MMAIERPVGGAAQIGDEPAAAAEAPDRLERVEVVLDELAAERADEELVGDGDEHAAQVGACDRADLLAGEAVVDLDAALVPAAIRSPLRLIADDT